MGAVTQFSLFGAEAAAPALEDLDGLMLAGAQWVRSVDGARLSVLVADRWRADALLREYRERSVAGTDGVKDLGGRFAARTAFSAELRAGAARWTRGARVGIPKDFQLGAKGLRLWTIAGGRRDGVGYLLATPAAAGDGILHRTAGSELARLGVAAVSLSQRPGPGWRITSAKRLRRFAELVGAPPPGAVSDWP
jgi:hypothetical protein